MARRSWRYLTLVLVASLLAVAAVVALAGELALRQTGDGPMCRGERATIVGTAGVDRLVGTPRRDVIVAGPGGDVVLARGGNDVICDREGADRVSGGRGDDEIGGGSGADRLAAGPGDDWLAGRRGADELLGGRGNDQLLGERGNDALRGNAGDDMLGGGSGRDNCMGGPGTDVMVDCESGEQGSDLPAPSPGEGQAPAAPTAPAAPAITNHAPSDVSLSPALVAENRPIGTTVGSLAATDPDAGDLNTYALVAGTGDGDNAAFTISGNELKTAQVFDYENKSSYSIRVRATDNGSPPLSVESVLTVTVTDANEPPTADDKTVPNLTEDDPATQIGLSGGDENGESLTFEVVSGPQHGQLDTNTPAATCGSGTPSSCTASIDYTPDPDFNGTDSFTYTVNDGTDDSTAATVSITVDPVNDVPVALAGSRTTDEDAPLALNLAALVGDVETADADLTYEIVTQPAHGTATATTYTPDADFNGPDGFTYRVTDRGDPDNCSSAPCDAPETSTTETVSITVDPVNDAPIASATSVSLNEDSLSAVDLAALVADVETSDANVAYEIVTAPAHGNLSGSGSSRSYTPDADFNGSDSFSYRVTDRGDPDNCSSAPCDGPETSTTETVSITVDPVNDAPIASATSVNLNEDSLSAVDLGALVADVETSDANVAYEIVTAPAHGNLSGSGSSRSYTPDADFNGSDSFSYRVTDRGDPDNCSSAPCDGPETSTTETVSITVDPVNDVPQASPLSDSLSEDGSLPVDLGALVSDVETGDGDLTYEVVTAPAHGTVSGSGSSRTYTPDLDFNGSDSFSYRVTDRGDPDNCSSAPCDGPETSATETVSITVDPVNDAPVNLLPAGPVAAVQDTDTPLAGISVGDVDAGTDDVELELSIEHGTLTVDTTVLGGVGPLPVAGNGTTAVTITASLAQINATLADAGGLVYRPAAGYTGPDTLTVTSDDLGHNGAGGPLTDTDTLSLVVSPPNAAPVAAAQSVSTNEDTAKTITLSASDADGDDPLSFSAGTPSNGSLGAAGAVSCTQATPNVCTADVVYTPAADFNGPVSFTFTANDGIADSAPATVSITVDPVNDAPKLQNIEAAALAYTENDAATLITATTTVTDVDSANLDTGTLTVDYATGGTADDRLEIQNVGQIAVSGSNVTHGGTTIGTFTGGIATTALVVTLNENVTAPIGEALVRAIAYRNVSDNPSTAARTVRFVLTDGDGGTSAPATRAINLTAVNDVPVLAAIESGALAYTENDPATAVTSSLTVSDPDSNITGATVSITANLAPAQDVLSFTNQLGITGTYNAATGVLTLTGSATPADYQTALRAVRYSNTSENPSTLTRTVSFRVQDGPGAGNLSNIQSRDVTVTAVNDAPVADDETFDGANGAIGNTALIVNAPGDGAPALSSPKKSISGDILAGDNDVDGPGPLTVTAGTFATNDGGSVTIEADGDFTYTPAAATSCTDTSDFFDYTLEDSGTPELTDTGRVTIAIAGCVWYVSNNATGNSGTSSAPFDTLAQAETASAANHTVFVFDGDNTSTGYGGDGYAMNAGERLIGEHEGLTVDPDGAGGPLASQTLHPANPGAHPTLTATNADVIDLDDGNELRGLNLDPQGTGGGVAGSSGDTLGGTIDNVNITDTGTAGTQPGLELDSTTGTFNVSNLTVSTNGATGARLNNAGTVSFASTGTISITSTNAAGLVATGGATGTNMGTSVFDAITVTGSGTGGVSMTNTTGTTTFGDLALTTTGATAAFALSNAGTVSVPAAGTDNLNATGGPAIDVTGTTVSTLAFDAVNSTNSANDGINLAGLGTGTFTAASGTIAGAAGIAFDLDGGNGTVTYPGALNNGTGATAEITGRTGGAVTLSGAIADTNDAGGGINLASNTGGSTTFSNASKVLDTTTSDAVSFTGSDDHTLNLTGGGLDVDTTTGRGIFANNSGTLVVSGTGNAIDSTSATALNVTNTDIGAGGATFQRISAGNSTAAADPVSGIVLNTTGSSAGLTVTGNGGTCTSAATCTGGAIQSSTATGISLTSVPGGASLTRMFVGASGDDGIGGSNVGGLSLDNATVTGNGNDPAAGPAPNGDHGVHFNNLTGTSTFTNSNVSSNIDSNVVVSNASGTLNLNVTGGTYSGASGGMGDGIFVEGTGTGSQNLNVQGPITFTNNVGDHVQHGSDAANTTDSDVTVNNATMTSPAAANGGPTCALNILGGGITVSHGGNSNTDATLTNNNIQNSCIGGIAVGTTGSVGDQQSAQVDATIQNNTIGQTGVAGSGSVQGNGIFVDSNGNGLVRALITGNTVRQWTNRNGLHLDVLDGDAEMSATVRNNVFTEPNSAFAGTTTRGMTIQLGSAQAGDSIDACLDIGATDASLKNQVAATGEAPQPDIRYLHEGPGSVVQLAGYTGPAAPSITDIAGYLQPRNNRVGTPTVTGIATASGGSTTSTVASCPLPAG